MIAFTSSRERRLWGAVVVVTAAIWATVGLAGRLAARLQSEGLLGAVFALAFVVVIGAVVGSAWVRRPGGREAWLALGIAAVVTMIAVRMGVGAAERSHLFEYGLLGVLIDQALVERGRGGRPVRAAALVAVLATAALGWIDEGIQAVHPERVYDLRDVGVNALAGLVAVSASRALAWARRRDFFARRR